MKFSATAVIFTAALGVSAHPSGHAHLNAHRSLNERADFVMNKKPVAVPTPAPAPVPAPAPAAPKPADPSPPAAKASSQSNGAQGAGHGEYVEFCGGANKRATLEQISYMGNIGTPSHPGCNLMTVQKSIADKYQYGMTFINKSGQDQVCVVWNKMTGPGKIDGFFNGKQALTFTLPANGEQVVVAQTNTQGGAACGVGSVPLNSYGSFASTWAEFDFGNLSNGGWSGADASCIVSAAQSLPIPPLSVCLNGKCSTVFSGGKGDNAFLGGMEALDGIGLNIPPGPVHLTINVGGH